MPFATTQKISKKAVVLWGAVIFLALAVFSVMLWHTVVHKKPEYVENALAEGKRATILISTGEILEGNLKQAGKTAGQEASPPIPPAAEVAAKEGKIVEPSPPPAPAQTASAPQESNAVANTGETPSPVVLQPNRVRVAIVIGGLGLSNATTERALALPKEITLGFSPYSHGLADWFVKSARAGHNVLLQIPMEPKKYPADDPGPFALLTELGAADNMKRLDWILTREDNYQGVYTDTEEQFTDSQEGTQYLIQALKRKGKLLVYGKGYTNNAFLQLAGGEDVPLFVNDLVIDDRMSADAIEENLAKLEAVAKKNGYAVGMGSPYPITIKILEKWLVTLADKGIQVVPVTQLHAKVR